MIWIFARPLVFCEPHRGNGRDTCYESGMGNGMGDGTDNYLRTIHGVGTGEGFGSGRGDLYGYGDGVGVATTATTTDLVIPTKSNQRKQTT